jgi:hypothetical protein
MSEVEYQYAIDYFSRDGERRGSLPVEPDWGPARECAQFLAVRRGIVPPVLHEGAGRVEPVWDSDCGAPVMDAARIVVAAETGDETVCEEVPSLPYFRQLAQQGSAAMVERGLLEKGELFLYKVCAYPGAPSRPDFDAGESPAFSVEEIDESLPLKERPVEPLLAGAVSRGTGGDPSDMRVFIPQEVMDAVGERSLEAGEVETGGVLVGNLHRCHSSPEIFLEVTAQIPAAHTESQATQLTFTADSWAAVQAAIDLRKRDELMCGWWHFHPDFCRKCPEEKRRECTISRPFFSPEDVHMHRAIFPRAFHVALLVSDQGLEPFDVNLFGWRHGMVVSRGFDVLGDTENDGNGGIPRGI